MTSYSYITWRNKEGFIPSPAPASPVPDPAETSWWHASGNPGSFRPSSRPGVTHVGNKQAAVVRADTQAHFAAADGSLVAAPPILYEIAIPKPEIIFNEIYIERAAVDQMRDFEDMFIASGAQIAFTWNTTESTPPAWSLLISRSWIGELPDRLTSDFSVLSTEDWEPGHLFKMVNPGFRWPL